MVLISRKDPGFKGRSAAHRFDVASFEAINCRHAGMTAIDLKSLHGATLLLMLLMMWLAPVPFVVALRSTSQTKPTTNRVSSIQTNDNQSQQQNLISSEELPLSPTSANRRRRHNVGRLISGAFATANQQSMGYEEDVDAGTDLRLSEIPDAMVDTRALLLGRYPESSPPYGERISMRIHAFIFHCRRAARRAYRTTGFLRDAALMFCAWFLIAAFQNFRSTGYDGGTDGQQKNYDHIFHTLFELVSAFGNVGLSLGSIQKPNAAVSYSHDLNAASLIVLCLVQIGARTRELPERVDSALTFPVLAAEDVLRATMIDDSGACTPAFQNELQHHFDLSCAASTQNTSSLPHRPQSTDDYPPGGSTRAAAAPQHKPKPSSSFSESTSSE
eukprot:CAMPEP_0197315384 /NCGR_PEP_ID=MMETSP0891-20130614/38020_1 /TAXON_ID=44058 ORGANISM="Aureoumbra lagunensis, Strain CCMP1510" /NCGR_SAMPLE_ID=MMETSP0891 /ASSEMBLY_ACC=CAM_ASM_000534 /LENGTH=386 /DNA_ID=CAMNT_0042804307 /DNA_START=1101 /DNA_END=2261 /DNA_ORIENTATION=+